MADELQIKVSLDNMTIGDLERLEKGQSPTEMIDIFQRLVVGVDVRELPIRALRTIVQAILAEIKEIQNGPN